MKELMALLGNQGFSTEQGTFGSEKEYNASLQQNKSGAHENIDKIINDEDTYHLIREILKAPDPKADLPTNEEIEAMLKDPQQMQQMRQSKFAELFYKQWQQMKGQTGGFIPKTDIPRGAPVPSQTPGQWLKSDFPDSMRGGRFQTGGDLTDKWKFQQKNPDMPFPKSMVNKPHMTQGQWATSNVPKQPKKDINTIIQEFMKTIFK